MDSVPILEAARWIQTHAGESSPPPLPLGAGLHYPSDVRAMHEQTAEILPLGCYQVHNCRLITTGLIEKDDALVAESAPLYDYTATLFRVGKLDGIGVTETRDLASPALLLYSAGVKIYGHWLIEFIPRAAIAKCALGSDFRNVVIPTPTECPPFVDDLLSFFVGVDREQILRFDHHKMSLRLKRAYVPSYAHTWYHLHSFVRELFGGLRSVGVTPHRRICIDRTTFEKTTRYPMRVLAERPQMHSLAERYGYELIDPAALSLAEQIRLFQEAAIIVGEFGSALHNSVFSDEGTRVGAIGVRTSIQSRIGARFRQVNYYVKANETEKDERGWTHITSSRIPALFAAMQDDDSDGFSRGAGGL